MRAAAWISFQSVTVIRRALPPYIWNTSAPASTSSLTVSVAPDSTANPNGVRSVMSFEPTLAPALIRTETMSALFLRAATSSGVRWYISVRVMAEDPCDFSAARTPCRSEQYTAGSVRDLISQARVE